MAKYEMNLVAIGTTEDKEQDLSRSASIYEDKDGHQHIVVRYRKVQNEELKESLSISDMVDGLKVLKFGVTPELTEEGDIKDEFLMEVPSGKITRVTYNKSRCVYSGETDDAEPKPLWTVYGAARYSVEDAGEGHEVSPLTVAEPVVVKATRKKAVVEETPVVETPAEETPAE